MIKKVLEIILIAIIESNGEIIAIDIINTDSALIEFDSLLDSSMINLSPSMALLTPILPAILSDSRMLCIMFFANNFDLLNSISNLLPSFAFSDAILK